MCARRCLTDNFIFMKYESDNLLHREYLELIFSDEKVIKYLGELSSFLIKYQRKDFDINENELYLVYYNYSPEWDVDNKNNSLEPLLIGFISKEYVDSVFEISSGILTEFQGIHYGPMILSEFSEYLFEYYNITELRLSINPTNSRSIHAASLAGYEKNGKHYSLFKR